MSVCLSVASSLLPGLWTSVSVSSPAPWPVASSTPTSPHTGPATVLTTAQASLGSCQLSPPFLSLPFGPVVEVFSDSVVFSMQIDYFKTCFCKYLCEYFSIVFDNIQRFHDLVISLCWCF